MIKKLIVENFKSIKSLEFDCKRVNLFIGEPNVGKSNVLEAIALQALQHTLNLSDLIRLNDLSNLFFENDPSNKIVVVTDKLKSEVSYEKGVVFIRFYNPDGNAAREFKGSFTDLSFEGQGAPWDFGIHPYFFSVLNNFPVLNYDFLSPPHGANLFFLLQTNKNLRNLVSEFVQDRGFKLTLRQKNYEIEISKEDEGILTSYPFRVISDTVQRIIFFVAAIESNKNGNVLIFEEPESNVFPYYTKYLAEKIGIDDSKQYFLTTHNPYFLQSLIEKTSLDDLSLNLVVMEDYETKVRPLKKAAIEKALELGSDIFLNFDKLEMA